MELNNIDPFEVLKENPHFHSANMIALCDGGGTPKYPCYYSFKILDSPFWIKRVPIEENTIPKGVIWKQTNNTAELASVYYTLLFIRKIYGTPKLILFHDSEFVIRFLSDRCNSDKPHLYTWKDAIMKLWWTPIWHQHISGKIMKRKDFLQH